MGAYFATAIIFSPTGNTRKILDAVLKGMDIKKINFVDLNFQNIRDTAASIEGNIVIIGSPVYAAGIPPVIIPFLEKLKGHNKATVLITTYGNISDGMALNELYYIAAKSGFNVVGAGCFIGEHSYSTAKHPVAAGRPNSDDLEKAAEFGKLIIEKLDKFKNHDMLLPKMSELVKEVAFLRKIATINASRVYAKSPTVNPNLCTHCGLCATHCPVNSIDPETMHILANKCIHCCSCIKRCPQHAIKNGFRFDFPVEMLLSFRGKRQKQPKWYL